MQQLGLLFEFSKQLQFTTLDQLNKEQEIANCIKKLQSIQHGFEEYIHSYKINNVLNDTTISMIERAYSTIIILMTQLAT